MENIFPCYAASSRISGLCTTFIHVATIAGNTIFTINAYFVSNSTGAQSYLARASSLTINPAYTRQANAIRNDHSWRLQELATFLFSAGVVTCAVLGVLSWQVLVLWYAIAVAIFILNSLRTLAAHAYRHNGKDHLTLVEQYLDSVNIPGNFLTGLWAPVGLRYHATHHLFYEYALP